MPSECRLAAYSLANLLADEARWSKSALIYTTALGAAENLYNAALSKAGQQSELAETNDIYRCAAYAYAQIGDYQTAIAILEQGCARGLRETLERDRADLSTIESTHPDLYHRYQSAAATVRNLEIIERSANPDQHPLSESERRQQATQARSGLNSSIADIRQLSGYESFLTLPTFNDVAATVQPDHPLVYLVTTPNGSLALILHRFIPDTIDIESIPLNFTQSDLRALLIGPAGDETMGGWFRAYSNRQTERHQWFQTIDEVTQALWHPLIAPIISALAQHNLTQAILIPSGLLSFLPLYSAWTDDATQPTGRRYALDDIRFTYAPNALSLKTARQIASTTPTTSILAIDEPTSTSANLLPNSQLEVTNAISTFPEYQVLAHDKATRQAVLEAMPNCAVLHFSCHGYANFQTPLDSGLLMANNELLTLRDFFDTQFNGIRLVILSACETGLPGTELPDEALSLPTGLLQAGVAGIAASLWSVDDLSTMMLLSRFYDYWRQERLPPSEALCQAQIWVRDTTNCEKITYFEQFMPDFIPQPSTNKMAGPVADFLFKSLMIENPDERSFSHPFHWAAFTYVGI